MDLYEYETIRKHLPNYPFISEVCENNGKNMHFHEELEIMRILEGEMCAVCGYSKYYFSHKFNEGMNMSFFDYLTKFRLEKAIEFIKKDKVNHTKAALLSGFGSARSFNRLFKKHYNLTPTEYFEKSQKNVDVAKKL